VLPAASGPAEFCRPRTSAPAARACAWVPGCPGQRRRRRAVSTKQKRTAQGATAIALAHARHGSTGLLPTFIHRQRRIVSSRRLSGDPRGDRRESPRDSRHPPRRPVPGDGPHRGAHDPGLIRPLTDGDVVRCSTAGSTPVLLLTVCGRECLAPEETRENSRTGAYDREPRAQSRSLRDCGGGVARLPAAAAGVHAFGTMPCRTLEQYAPRVSEAVRQWTMADSGP